MTTEQQRQLFNFVKKLCQHKDDDGDDDVPLDISCGDARNEEWIYPGRTTSDHKLHENEQHGLHGAEANAVQNGKSAPFRRSSILRIGKDHPDSLCEVSAVAGTRPPPFSEQDDLRIPMWVADAGKISSPQLETICYAARRFRQRLPESGARAGFLLGDGTGCGKGRCIASLILDQWNRGARRLLWVSASTDLYEDAKRDFNDIGAADIPLISLSKISGYGAIDGSLGRTDKYLRSNFSKTKDGVLFVTYSMLTSMRKGGASSKETAELFDADTSRYGQVKEWLCHHHSRGDGLLCFDEAHKAKNLAGGAKIAQLVVDLQQDCTDSAVLYATATGATEVNHFMYMERLGLWGTDDCAFTGDMSSDLLAPKPLFRSFRDFRAHVERGGICAMELVAIQLRAMGAMSCRSLSFVGTTFELLVSPLSGDERDKYNQCVYLWNDMKTVIDRLPTDADRSRRNLGAQFWGAQLRFFKSLLVAFKVKKTVEMTKDALTRGEAVVISLWSTNEARSAARAASGDCGGDVGFDSGPELIAEHILDQYAERSASCGTGADELMLLKVRLKSLQLPPNPIDALIEQLGGVSAVAEMSGRTHRQVLDPVTGVATRERRKAGSGQDINLVEQKSFQHGKKHVAVITEAASAGISLHSDRRLLETGGSPPRRRRMICIELAWAADKAVQQLGRIHRSNQIYPPAFMCVVSDVGGEARFVSAVARRLQQLGAMTRGDRSAAVSSDENAFSFGDMDVMSSSHGRKAQSQLCTDLKKEQIDQALVPSSCIDGQWLDWAEFAKDAKIALEKQAWSQNAENDKPDVLKQFLNRLLGTPYDIQNCLFQALTLRMNLLKERDRDAGVIDQGVITLNHHSRWGRLHTIEELSSEDFGPETSHLKLLSLQLDRGIPWETAWQMFSDAPLDNNGLQGFYMRNSTKVTDEPVLVLHRYDDQYVLHYPYAGWQTDFNGTSTRLRNLQNSPHLIPCKRDSLDNVKAAWCAQHDRSASQCLHRQRNFLCKDPDCQTGRRLKQQKLLTGQLLGTWDHIVNAVREAMSTSRGQQQAGVVRANMSSGASHVGVLLPEGAKEFLSARLEEAAMREKVKKELESKDSSSKQSQIGNDLSTSEVEEERPEPGNVAKRFIELAVEDVAPSIEVCSSAPSPSSPSASSSALSDEDCEAVEADEERKEMMQSNEPDLPDKAEFPAMAKDLFDLVASSRIQDNAVNPPKATANGDRLAALKARVAQRICKVPVPSQLPSEMKSQERMATHPVSEQPAQDSVSCKLSSDARSQTPTASEAHCEGQQQLPSSSSKQDVARDEDVQSGTSSITRTEHVQIDGHQATEHAGAAAPSLSRPLNISKGVEAASKRKEVYNRLFANNSSTRANQFASAPWMDKYRM
eukprot:gnl/MRDRNA2_/MRDRNA2_123318_c0_seq1.p1 gnl/MRDRNA2_/MRDRNA2_123318_c0~~gnl/MRDRNA2_/MRDRNA2_123318_c0_seq1.p1  ORF type:complete len:1586 (-),score=337.38 gnl/MRDRNA2_/MRDRNA2_123318_c0_seq1:81-4226(-)